MSTINSFLQLDSSQYAQVPIGATRVATRGNTSGNCYGTITPWVATSDWTVEFDVIFAPTAVGDRYFLDAPSDGSNRFALYTNTSGKLQWTALAEVTVYVDDVQITNSAWSHPTDGVIRKVKIVGVGRQVGFGTILSRYSNTQNSGSILFNLRLTDLTTPANSRFYPMNSLTGVTTPVNEITNMYGSVVGGNPEILPPRGPSYTTIVTKTASGTGTATDVDTYDTVDLVSGSSGRAFIAQSYTFKANKTYLLMARFSNVVNSNPSSTNSVGLTFISTANIALGGGSPKVNSDGLWAVLVQYSVDTTTTFRIGVGMSNNVVNCSARVSEYSLYELPSFVPVGGALPPTRGAWTGKSKPVVSRLNAVNTYDATGKVTENALVLSPRTDTYVPYRVGVYVSDSFGNDVGDWPDILSGYGYALFGGSWPGQNLSYFLTKADNVFARTGLTNAGDAKPDFAICQSSINSVSSNHTAAQMLSDMAALINKASTQGLRVFVTNCTPFGTGGMTSQQETELKSYNAGLPSLCASLNAILVDVYTLVSDPSNRSNLLSEYTTDGKHLSSAGVSVYASALNTAINDARSSAGTAPTVWNVTWHNRTSGDVVTVYPDAIKPAETFFVAARLRVTSLGSEQYPMAFSVGGALGSTLVKLQARTDGGLTLEVWDISPTGVKTALGGASIAGVAPSGDWNSAGPVIVIAKKNGMTGQTEMWVDKNSGYHSANRPVSGYAIQSKINLNGEIDTSGSVIRKISGINFHYVYLYSALSAGDITALMQGANPETVGTIRQGYNLNGNGNEKNGGNPLVLYGSPEYVKERRKSKHNTVESIVCGIAYGV